MIEFQTVENKKVEYMYRHSWILEMCYSSKLQTVPTYIIYIYGIHSLVTIGNGEMASFWTSSWINENTPKNIAPTLFKKVKIKNIIVQKALQDNRWRSHITPLLTLQEINEYVSLFEAVGHIQLVDNREDSIYWRWMSYGEYTTKSAYNIQFQGAFSKFRFMPICKAKAEPKCRFFCLDFVT